LTPITELTNLRNPNPRSSRVDMDALADIAVVDTAMVVESTGVAADLATNTLIAAIEVDTDLLTMEEDQLISQIQST
jgi:hypothetical protein